MACAQQEAALLVQLAERLHAWCSLGLYTLAWHLSDEFHPVLAIAAGMWGHNACCCHRLQTVLNCSTVFS